MEHDFWQVRWENDQLGFHLAFVHPILRRQRETRQIALDMAP